MFRRSLILLIGFWIGSNEAINVTNSRYRQNYHIIAPTGWLNDPNGLSYFNGNYHVFFQYDPTSSNGGGPKQWGHVTSTDLVNWKYTQPTIALAPDQSYDVGGVWTGSAVNNNGELTAIYTGLHNNTGEQLVNIATSTDGVTFTKYSGNPVVPTQPIDGTNQFRDPKVWKYNGVWYMVVGNQSKKNHGRTVLYQSDDLRQWTYLGPLADEPDNRVGSMWECPNFFYINGKHVLFMGTDVERDGDHFANQGLNVYFIGDFNYETKVFSHAVDFYELDNGHDFYAAQMFQDPKNRTILFAWMNSFGTNFEEMQDGWAHTLTVPRQLRLSSDGSRVQMIPVDELTLLRGTEYINSPIEIEGTYDTGIPTSSTEILLNFSLAETTAQKIGLSFPLNTGHDLRLYYDKQTGKLVLERTKDVRQVDMGSIMQLNLRIFLDQSSIEVFANDGNVTMSSRYYKDPIPTITLFAEYGVANVEFQAFRLNNIWNNNLQATTTESISTTFSQKSTNLPLSTSESISATFNQKSTNLHESTTESISTTFNQKSTNYESTSESISTTFNQKSTNYESTSESISTTPKQKSTIEIKNKTTSSLESNNHNTTLVTSSINTITTTHQNSTPSSTASILTLLFSLILFLK